MGAERLLPFLALLLKQHYPKTERRCCLPSTRAHHRAQSWQKTSSLLRFSGEGSSSDGKRVNGLRRLLSRGYAEWSACNKDAAFCGSCCSASRYSNIQ